MRADKPSGLKFDKDFMVEFNNHKFPCTDANSMSKLLWDRILEGNISPTTFKLEVEKNKEYF